MEVISKNLVIYQTQEGDFPFEEWLNSLRDIQVRAIIRKRLNRVRLGNLGDSRSVGDGVFELKIDFGPGYRVYFGEQNKSIVVLLCGGDKSTQNKDIKLAQQFWLDYLS